MIHPQQTRFSWLTFARGAFYILMGAFLFIFATGFSPSTGRLVGALLLLAGVVGISYSMLNRRADSNNWWGLLQGANDSVFGVVLLFVANGGVHNFIDMLGFWAVIFAFLQAVQAMYLALMQGGASLPLKAVHFLTVGVLGYMAFNMLLRPIGPVDSLGITGFFPIALGILIIVRQRLTQRTKVTEPVAH